MRGLPTDLISIVNIGLLTYKDERFGVDESFDDFLKYEYNGSMMDFLNHRSRLAEKQRFMVLVAARLL